LAAAIVRNYLLSWTSDLASPFLTYKAERQSALPVPPAEKNGALVLPRGSEQAHRPGARSSRGSTSGAHDPVFQLGILRQPSA